MSDTCIHCRSERRDLPLNSFTRTRSEYTCGSAVSEAGERRTQLCYELQIRRYERVLRRSELCMRQLSESAPVLQDMVDLIGMADEIDEQLDKSGCDE